MDNYYVLRLKSGDEACFEEVYYQYNQPLFAYFYKRIRSTAFASVDLNTVYEERCREFAWESWHRNDMIRFGKFEGKWSYKTDADINKRIFPIPTGAMSLNPKIRQNPGYN